MNWIILEEHEQVDSSLYLLDSIKSNHIRNILRKNIGDPIKIILPNLRNDIGKVTNFTKDATLIEYPFSESFKDINFKMSGTILDKIAIEDEDSNQKRIPLLKLRLVLPLPRPQTGKKILHLAACYGVAELIFILPKYQNKEFLTSPTYSSQGLWKELKTGMEQSGNWMVPRVEIQTKNLKSYLDSSSTDTKIALDPRMSQSLYDLDIEFYREEKTASTLEVHFGSESGFTAEDLEFLACNCLRFSLSDTVIRTEYAVANVLGILQGKGRRK